MARSSEQVSLNPLSLLYERQSLLAVALASIVLNTILGAVLGVFSVSTNWPMQSPIWSLVWLCGVLFTIAGQLWLIWRFRQQWSNVRQENASLFEASLESQRDVLTGLPNGVIFKDQLEQAILRAKQNDKTVALLSFNIARIRVTNENFSHQDSRDALLQAIAQRLHEHLETSSTVAQVGAGKFVLLLEDIDTPETIMPRALQLQSMLEQRYCIDEQFYDLTFYIGISQFPEDINLQDNALQDTNNVEALLRYADQAAGWLKQARQQGISIYAHGRPSYKPSNQVSDKQHHSSQEHAVRRAFEQQELCLYYQPQIDLFNYSLLGFEALLRWNHPQHGILSPDHVIPIAEEIGLIDSIGRWALHDACTQGRRWQKCGFESLTVSVNVSARQFMQNDFVRQVEQELRATEFAPESLKLELTESMLLPDAKHTLRMLHQLQELGVQLALDDFGTGYASLSYLTKFPLDWLKIDKSFVQEVAANPDNAAIVTTTITLAHSLGMKVIAEGVEDGAQLAFIRRHHGDAAQGYHFSRPLPQAAACDWLKQPKLPLQVSTISNRTVLLLEDDELQRQLYTLWLKSDKYQIITASDANKAFALLARHSVDVVLVDYILPGMNGVEFLRRIRSIYPNTVRVMVSASTDRNALAKAINDGSIFRFLDKPVSGEILRQTVRQAIASQEKNSRMTAFEAS